MVGFGARFTRRLGVSLPSGCEIPSNTYAACPHLLLLHFQPDHRHSSGWRRLHDIATFPRVEIWVQMGNFDSRGKSISVDADGPLPFARLHWKRTNLRHLHTHPLVKTI